MKSNIVFHGKMLEAYSLKETMRTNVFCNHFNSTLYPGLNQFRKTKIRNIVGTGEKEK